MPDPQDSIKRWFSEKLAQKGHKAHADLARRLNVSIDAVRRMRNLDGTKESRRIEAHHIPIMAEFFGEWPPGYDMNRDSEANTSDPSRDFKIDSGGGNVTIIDKSIHVIGDAATVHTSSHSAEGNLLGKLNIAIWNIYREHGRNLSLEELGRLAYQFHEEIIAACKSADEYPHAIEIVKLRLKKLIERDMDQE